MHCLEEPHAAGALFPSASAAHDQSPPLCFFLLPPLPGPQPQAGGPIHLPVCQEKGLLPAVHLLQLHAMSLSILPDTAQDFFLCLYICVNIETKFFLVFPLSRLLIVIPEPGKHASLALHGLHLLQADIHIKVLLSHPPDLLAHVRRRFQLLLMF